MNAPLLCHRCGTPLESGSGNLYIVRVEAFADPTGPRITPEDMEKDLQGEIERLIDEMRDASERELTGQVYRRLTLHLCRPCFELWIENPTG